MKLTVAMGQFAVSREWPDNLNTCQELIRQAASRGVQLLVLPEGILARDIADPDLVRKTAQPLDGPFMSALLAFSIEFPLTVMLSVHVPDTSNDEGKVWNIQVAIRQGQIIAQYRKLHLYDAFAVQESRNVVPGHEVPPLVYVDGFKIGMMTCYDVRFPELARRLVLDGADALVLPAAWVKGPLKEMHWDVLVTARALENTCYMIAVGECGPRNIGQSKVVDPLGVVIASATEQPALVISELDDERIRYARESLPALVNRKFATPVLSGE